jgi:hypothetical protein
MFISGSSQPSPQGECSILFFSWLVGFLAKSCFAKRIATEFHRFAKLKASFRFFGKLLKSDANEFPEIVLEQAKQEAQRSPLLLNRGKMRVHVCPSWCTKICQCFVLDPLELNVFHCILQIHANIEFFLQLFYYEFGGGGGCITHTCIKKVGKVAIPYPPPFAAAIPSLCSIHSYHSLLCSLPLFPYSLPCPSLLFSSPYLSLFTTSCHSLP